MLQRSSTKCGIRSAAFGGMEDGKHDYRPSSCGCARDRGTTLKDVDTATDAAKAETLPPLSGVTARCQQCATIYAIERAIAVELR